MTKRLHIKTYDKLPHNLREIKRYMGMKSDVNLFDEIIYNSLELCEGEFDYKVCYGVFDIKICENIIDFGFSQVKSSDLAKNLSGCNKAVIFAATAGIGIDRLIRLNAHTDSAVALCIDAIGSDAAENLCNTFEADVTADYARCAPRFSPGYGDLPLEFQKEIFKALSCEKNIGLYLNDSLLMVPTKSVTAIIGVSSRGYTPASK